LTTLQRRMKDLEYVIRVSKRKPLLNIVQWAKEHVSEDLQFWKLIIFSDESKLWFNWITVEKYDKKGEEFNPECIQKTVKYLASVMVWGAFHIRVCGA